MKLKGGYILVEVIVVICLASTIYFTTRYMINKIYVNEAYKQKIKIISIIDYVQKKAVYDNRDYEIIFNLESKEIYYLDKVIKPDDKFTYITKNISNNFKRKVNKQGNFDKGFTIEIIKKDKIYSKISVNTSNGLNIPLIKDRIWKS